MFKWVVLALAAVLPGGAGALAAQETLAASNARWSPDGERVVFYAAVDSQTDLFLRSKTGDTTRLTETPASDYGPDFSPDGKLIVFYSGHDREFGVRVMRLDNREVRSIDCGGSYEGNPHFAPDGSSIVLSSNRDGNHEIYLAELDGPSCRRLTENDSNDWTPRFSPDGRRIVFASDRRGDFDIFTMARDGSDVRLAADVHEHDYYPDWSPDGSRVAFFSGPDPESFQVHIVDLKTSEVTPVTRAPWTATSPAWSPDGRWLLVGATRDGVDQLLLVSPDGKTQEPAFGPGEEQ